MGCGGSKSNSSSEKKSRAKEYTGSTDPSLSGTADSSRRGSKNSRRSSVQLSAREKLVYERAGSDDGERCDEPSAPAKAVSTGWAKVKATVLDKIKSKNDVQTRLEFERLMANFKPAKKLVLRCSYWLSEVNQCSREMDDDVKTVSLLIPAEGSGHAHSRYNQQSLGNSSSVTEATELVPCYLDRYMEDVENNNFEVVAASQCATSDGHSHQAEESSMAMGSMLSSIKTLGSEASNSSARLGHGGRGVLKRSPQVRNNGGGGINNSSFGPGGSHQGGSGSPQPTMSPQNGGLSPRANDHTTTPGATMIDDMDAMMYGGGTAHTTLPGQIAQDIPSPAGGSPSSTSLVTPQNGRERKGNPAESWRPGESGEHEIEAT